MRNIKKSDQAAVRQLVNEVFHPPVMMEEAFPLLFAPQNLASYVMEYEAGIRSFIGVQPQILELSGIRYPIVLIGSVCTHSSYQNGGLLRTLFSFMIEDLKKQGVVCALVSGGGKLYRDYGCVSYGSFFQYQVTKANILQHDYEVRTFDGSLKQQLELYEQLQCDHPYVTGFHEFIIMLNAAGASHVLGLNQQIRLVYQADRCIAAIIAGIGPSSRVLAWGKHEAATYAGIQHLLSEYSLETMLWISKQELNCAKIHACEQIVNDGTILHFSAESKLIADQIPYTLGLHFV